MPDAANVRRRDDRAKSSLRASLKQFGPGRSIVVDEKDIVRAGNGTLEAAQAAGISEVLVIEPKDGQLVAVRRRNWTATEATAYAIADNRLGDLSTFDPDGLVDTLRSLQSEDFDVASIGFTDDEVDDMARQLEGTAPPDAGLEELPPEKWLIVIECGTEQRQVELLERFKAEDLKCNAYIA